MEPLCDHAGPRGHMSGAVNKPRHSDLDRGSFSTEDTEPALPLNTSI